MNRDLIPVKAQIHGVVELFGYFTTASDGTVATQYPSGTLAKNGQMTVTKPTGTGIYLVTFSGQNTAIVYANASIAKAAGTYDGDVQPVTDDQSAGSGIQKFQVKKTSDGTALDAVSATIFFHIVVKNSSVVP